MPFKLNIELRMTLETHSSTTPLRPTYTTNTTTTPTFFADNGTVPYADNNIETGRVLTGTVQTILFTIVYYIIYVEQNKKSLSILGQRNKRVLTVYEETNN